MIPKYSISRIISILCFITTLNSLAQYTLIPDSKFETKLIQLGIDTDGLNGKVLTSNIATVTNLQVSDAQITDLTGIQDFTSLVTLRCKNNKLTNLNLSNNVLLSTLQCFENQIVNLNCSNNKALLTLDCSSNLLQSLDLSENIALVNLNCSNNQLTTLILNNNTKLVELYCYTNSLNNLLLNNNTALTNLYCQENNLGNLDVTKNVDLIEIICFKNYLKSINLSNCIKLSYIDVSTNILNSLDIRSNPILADLNCSINSNLSQICVNDSLAASNNPRFIKDQTAEWSESCIVTNIEKLDQIQELNVYPNPATNSFAIDINESVNVSLINSLGETVILNKTLDVGNNTIRVDHLPAGIYMLKLFNESFKVNKPLIIR